MLFFPFSVLPHGDVILPRQTAVLLGFLASTAVRDSIYSIYGRRSWQKYKRVIYLQFMLTSSRPLLSFGFVGEKGNPLPIEKTNLHLETGSSHAVVNFLSLPVRCVEKIHKGIALSSKMYEVTCMIWS